MLTSEPDIRWTDTFAEYYLNTYNYLATFVAYFDTLGPKINNAQHACLDTCSAVCSGNA